MAAGNTGVQMGGWFNREIKSVDDLNGLKMRIPGLGGEVLKRAGGTPVSLPGGEIFTSLQSGAIDATEWVGPYNDLAFGFYKAAKYYYYPGWHEPGTTLECFVNKKAFEALPADLQSIVINAARVANQDMLADFTAKNNAALQTLVEQHNVDLRPFPADVLETLKKLSDEVVAEIAEKDPLSKKVYASYIDFRGQAIAWHNISERAYLNARAMG
jgi:TRAP-type mannitol/chloroaromatic compound transport system substrate-binding protein